MKVDDKSDERRTRSGAEGGAKVDDRSGEGRTGSGAKAEVLAPRRDQPLEVSDEPPVVARLIVEIRSDGSRTIARGAIEDVASGQRTAIEARGNSPIQLALALARSLGSLPRLAARSTIRGLLGRKK